VCVHVLTLPKVRKGNMDIDRNAHTNKLGCRHTHGHAHKPSAHMHRSTYTHRNGNACTHAGMHTQREVRVRTRQEEDKPFIYAITIITRFRSED
jgi:hypothetical protein